MTKGKTPEEKFFDFIKECSKLSKNKLFRGHADDSWSLLPNIARETPEKNTVEIEEKMLNEFRRLATTLLPDPDATQKDLLVLAQHYGMKTRLLDWSSNPLVALWFACQKEENSNGVVYIYFPDESNEKSVLSPFKIETSVIYRPRMNNPRIIAQSGCFTIHAYSNEKRRFVPFDEEKNGKVRTVIIEAKWKSYFLKKLDNLGINERALFPELSGVCKYINWQLENGFFKKK
jgi:hypothetical protein